MRKACRAYRVYYSRPTAEEIKAGDYLMDHSIISYLLDPEGIALASAPEINVRICSVCALNQCFMHGRRVCGLLWQESIWYGDGNEDAKADQGVGTRAMVARKHALAPCRIDTCPTKKVHTTCCCISASCFFACGWLRF